MTENSIEMLQAGMENSLLCCGLDPDLSKIPNEPSYKELSDERKVVSFLKSVVDLTAPNVCAYKIQKAFFDRFPLGHDALKETISYIHTNHKGIPAIVDCKIGDIGNTMQAYLDNLFNELHADGIVVNPYMGDDVMKPMVQYPNKAIVVLAKTSNPGGGVVQDVLTKDGIPMWQHVLKLTTERWNESGNMIPVISSTVGLDMTNVRKLIPDYMPILLAGVGAQGGTYVDLSKLLNSQRSGVFVNSSRGIIYAKAESRQAWQDAISESSKVLKEALNKERK